MLFKNETLSNGLKSAFLNGILLEKVYVEQPKGFKDHKFLNEVYNPNIS